MGAATGAGSAASRKSVAFTEPGSAVVTMTVGGAMFGGATTTGVETGSVACAGVHEAPMTTITKHAMRP
ncbi:MAG: hypothetical protein EBY11_14665 [Proteobacteria bacterium]|nr:hypothetical protein [Pseudomonadota bacterium]